MIYFKAVPPLFAVEPAVTQLLAARYPDHVPQVVAIDTDRSWILLREFTGRVLEESPLADWSAALRLWGQRQESFTGQIDALLAAGCHDRRLPILAAQVDALLVDPLVLAALTEEELAQLRAQAPRLQALCAELAAYAVPASLMHGDFHAFNVIVDAGNIVIYDWTDACVAHPFLDMATIVEWMRENTPEARAAVWDAYLTAWTGYESPERLREAARRAEVLGSLHQAISYRQIIASLEPEARRELAGGLPQWVRRMLKLMTTYGFAESA
jgi:aminoglycoside/choline kinase family phosphotransferase